MAFADFIGASARVARYASRAGAKVPSVGGNQWECDRKLDPDQAVLSKSERPAASSSSAPLRETGYWISTPFSLSVL